MLAGPEGAVEDDLLDGIVEVRSVGFVSGAEVEDSADAFALSNAATRAGGELRVDALSDRPNQAAREVLAAEREVALEDHGLGRRHVERRAVHFFGLKGEVAHSEGDRVLSSAHGDFFRVVALSPAALQVAGGAEDGLERLAVVAAVEANEAKAMLLHADLDLFGEFIVHFAVAGMAPPEEDVGGVEKLVGQALIGFVEANGVNIEQTFGVEFFQSVGDCAAEASWIKLLGSVRGIFVPNENFECHRVYFVLFATCKRLENPSRSISRILYLCSDLSTRPTRRIGGPRHLLPIWSCFRWGLHGRGVTSNAGELLPHHFNLTSR